MPAQPITKNFKQRVKYEMGIRGIRPLEMAVAMRMAERTFYARLAKPDEFTLGEIDAMSKKLHVQPNELLFGSLTGR